MSWLVNVVTAEEEEIEEVGGSDHPVDRWSGLEARDLDTAKFATLHCLLCEDDYEDALSFYEPVWVNDMDGAMVLRLPDAMSERLVQMEEDALEAVAEELAATEEFELAGWPTQEVHDLLVQLADLAHLADSQGQVLLAWMHPLRT